MKKQIQGFREFLLKQNALALAIGVVIGAAVGRVVSGIVDDVIMPVVGLALPGGEWRNAAIALPRGNAIKYGDLAGRLLDFLIVALVVYLVTKAILEKPAPPPPDTKTCPQCLEIVPAAARRCRACTSQLVQDSLT
ncbi:MAG TPA: large conductance mechanosensitive channel protein MscL [Myxococcales bacterium]|nr:large conductance mechanosensitive channel protein MscL [Myxococcales bacterium]